MFTSITISLIYLLIGIGVIAILLVTVLYKSYWLAYYQKYSDTTATRYKTDTGKLASAVQALHDHAQKLENDSDILWIQLLQWREFAEENRSFRHGILPSVKNEGLHKLAAELDERFAHLFEITERGRPQYMEILRQKEDYEADVNLVMTKIAGWVSGMNLGEKADETPILNSNREN